MARAVATIPPEVGLPGIVGGRMSLNLFIAQVGASGGGKGIAEAVAAEGLRFLGPPVDTVPLGSGEGIARTFRPQGTAADANNPITAAIFTAPEIDSIAAIASRTGSTLSAELRKVYSGEQLGFGNAGKDTRNIVAAGSYRACLTVGVQPLRSQALLGASDGGLPQRFVWLPTSDPDAPDEPPADPGVWEVERPAWERGTGDLEVPDIATTAIRKHRLAVLREEPGVDPLDGHALLTRLKVAAALMALDGGTVIAAEHWKLAGWVMDVSTYTRERCQWALAEHSRRANTARALASAERDEIVSERKLQRAKDGIRRKLADGSQQPRNRLRSSLKVDLRDYFDPAAEELAEAGEITITAAKSGAQKVQVYQWYRPEKQVSTSDDETCTKGTPVPPRLELAADGEPRRRTRTRGKHRPSQQTQPEGQTA